MNRTDLDRNRAVAIEVARYTRHPNPIEHERLLPRVADSFGDDAAEFFDREGRLPLRSAGLPWPMEWSAGQTYSMAVVVLSLACGATALVTLASVVPMWVAALLAGALGAALWFGIPAVTRRFPPADLEERTRLVRVFAEMAEVRRTVREENALGARMGRLLGDNDERPHEG